MLRAPRGVNPDARSRGARVQSLAEAALCLYFVAGLVWVAAQGALAPLPFLALYAVGFGWAAWPERAR